ncbi:MAG: hypothetical protein J6F30_04425 [Cellulosilyticum sp.]|nr:hypothetical protein [Cellulosilyticum sp.]
MQLTNYIDDEKCEVAIRIAEISLGSITLKDENYDFCRDTIELCREWLRQKKISKVDILERASSHGRAIADIVMEIEDYELANKYGSILTCVLYIAWQAYNYEEDYYYPQELELMDDDELETLIEELLEEGTLQKQDFENILKNGDKG